jgi:hypothetical protein
MNHRQLKLISDLRAMRANLAMAELQTANKARDDLLKAAAVLRGQIAHSIQTAQQAQTTAYREAVGKTVKLHDLERVEARLNHHKAQTQKVVSQFNHVKGLAEGAVATADQARLSHAKVTREKTKWDKVQERQIEGVQEAEIASEEIEIENLLTTRQR